ncbi:AAA family ATPase [Spirillospora sp. NPDC048911]|uniref:AAA family ATPase n=1 Tax=Spirillospora sp. NPDC048911 TaxID=3364527 RepID=UPI0037233D36
MSYDLTLPGGGVLNGQQPVVVLGPNGSGKTRQTRQITAPVTIEFINALRNTRVAPELPAMGMDTARNNYFSQRNQARANHWEQSGDFDSMLSQLLAQHSMAAIEFMTRVRADPSTAGMPEETTLSQIEALWRQVFPGRELIWRGWKPLVKNEASGTIVEYSGNHMSDGEKAALYLAGRVLTADPGILIVDEPETHLHSLLAVRLWNQLEETRPDLRFVYVTHDLTFALSRKDAHFVVASPTDGLRVVGVDEALPSDVAEALLGSASLSFYASRVVFCEGDSSSIDSRLYEAWFRGPDTVVRPVESCHRVIRCVDASNSAGITMGLTAVGIIDGDYHPAAFGGSLGDNVTILDVHEAESLLCLPEVVSAVCSHLTQAFDVAKYREMLAKQVTEDQRHQIIIARWKRRMEPLLEGLVSGVSKRQIPVDKLASDLTNIFDHTKWTFSPETILLEEKERVERAVPEGTIEEFLKMVPGKQLLPIAARMTGVSVPTYQKLVCNSLRDDHESLRELGHKVEGALQPYLPPRYALAMATAKTV